MFLVYGGLILSAINVVRRIHLLDKREKAAHGIVPSSNVKHIFKMIKEGIIACRVGENHAEKFDPETMLESYKSPAMRDNIRMIQTVDIQNLRLQEIYGTDNN